MIKLVSITPKTDKRTRVLNIAEMRFLKQKAVGHGVYVTILVLKDGVELELMDDFDELNKKMSGLMLT